jgi:hypothetical protein
MVNFKMNLKLMWKSSPRFFACIVGCTTIFCFAANWAGIATPDEQCFGMVLGFFMAMWGLDLE